MATKKQLEARLTLQQRKAAYLLVENDLEMPDNERYNQDEIADMVGCGRTTLYRWRTQDESFIDYMNLLADDYFKAKRSFVYRQLMRTISGKQPSIKGLDLYMKRFGMLTERHEVVGEVVARSNDDLLKGMEELDALLEGEELELIEQIEGEEELTLLKSIGGPQDAIFEDLDLEDDEEEE